MSGVSILKALAHLSLSRQFLITSLPVDLLGMLAIGLVVSQKVKKGVVNRLGGVTGLYVESFVTPHAQTLLTADDLIQEDRSQLGKLLAHTPLGERIVAFKVRRSDGRSCTATMPR